MQRNKGQTDPVLALGLLRIPDHKRHHQQRPQNHREDLIQEVRQAYSMCELHSTPSDELVYNSSLGVRYSRERSSMTSTDQL